MNPNLTHAELDVLRALWSVRQGTVAEVREQYLRLTGTDPAYTTVMTLLGRVVAIADTYDAMTSDRSYRKALPHDVAIAELERCAGAQFDAELVSVFIAKVEEHRREQQASGKDVPR